MIFCNYKITGNQYNLLFPFFLYIIFEKLKIIYLLYLLFLLYYLLYFMEKIIFKI